MLLPENVWAQATNEDISVQPKLIGNMSVPGDHLTSQLELLLQQIKQVVKDELRVVISSQEKTEEFFKQRFDRGPRNNHLVSDPVMAKPAETQGEEILGEEHHGTSLERQTSLSERLRLSELATGNGQQQSPRGRSGRSRHSHFDDLKMTALKSVENSMSLKKWMSSSAYQATLENKDLDATNARIWPGRTKFEWLVCTSAFDMTAGLFIVANAIMIGADVSYRAAHAEPSKLFQVISIAFALIFTAETVIRFAANHVSVYFRGPDCNWNYFDLVMLVVSLLEVADSISVAEQEDAQDIIRMVKMIRLLRIFRVMRFIPQLRIMVFMIFESARSLVWLLLILGAILYVFAAVFTMAGTEYLMGFRAQDGKTDRLYAVEVAQYYGSVFRSIYTCFKAITSGQSWGEVMDPLLNISAFYAIIFLFFIAFSLFALFNIITGVFVDGAMEKSKHDRDLVAEKEMAYKKACIENLKAMFQESDADNSGTISAREFEAHMLDPKFVAYLEHLSIDTSNCSDLFSFLDSDASGQIDIDEFIEGMMHLIRGQSTEQYTQKLLKEHQTLLKHMHAFMDFVENEFAEIKQFAFYDGQTVLNRVNRDTTPVVGQEHIL